MPSEFISTQVYPKTSYLDTDQVIGGVLCVLTAIVLVSFEEIIMKKIYICCERLQEAKPGNDFTVRRDQYESVDNSELKL
jgi:hypothetical protein